MEVGKFHQDVNNFESLDIALSQSRSDSYLLKQHFKQTLVVELPAQWQTFQVLACTHRPHPLPPTIPLANISNFRASCGDEIW